MVLVYSSEKFTSRPSFSQIKQEKKYIFSLPYTNSRKKHNFNMGSVCHQLVIQFDQQREQPVIGTAVLSFGQHHMKIQLNLPKLPPQQISYVANYRSPQLIWLTDWLIFIYVFKNMLQQEINSWFPTKTRHNDFRQ